MKYYRDAVSPNPPLPTPKMEKKNKTIGRKNFESSKKSVRLEWENIDQFCFSLWLCLLPQNNTKRNN